MSSYPLGSQWRFLIQKNIKSNAKYMFMWLQLFKLKLKEKSILSLTEKNENIELDEEQL